MMYIPQPLSVLKKIWILVSSIRDLAKPFMMIKSAFGIYSILYVSALLAGDTDNMARITAFILIFGLIVIEIENGRRNKSDLSSLMLVIMVIVFLYTITVSATAHGLDDVVWHKALQGVYEQITFSEKKSLLLQLYAIYSIRETARYIGKRGGEYTMHHKHLPYQ